MIEGHEEQEGDDTNDPLNTTRLDLAKVAIVATRLAYIRVKASKRAVLSSVS